MSTVRLPRRGWWRRALATRHPARTGPDSPRELVAAMEAEYRSLIESRPPWADASPTLRFHLAQSIAPALACYLVLRRRGLPAPEAANEVGDHVEAQMAPVLALVGVLDRLRLPFGAIRAINRRLIPRMFPAAGFAITWTDDDDASLRFEFSGCFYLRILRHYGAPELTGAFCRGDELAYERMPRSVRFTRLGTMAAGAARCDFTLRPARGLPTPVHKGSTTGS